MPRFSERIGASKPVESLQVDSMSDALRNSLWNLLVDLYERDTMGYWVPVARYVARFFRKVPLDELPSSDNSVPRQLH